MLGGSFFREFENDPFFSSHQEMMSHHQRMMNGMLQDPFAMLGSAHPLALTDGRPQPNQRDPGRGQRNRRQELAPRDMFAGGMDPFGGIFGHMNSMMGNMRSLMGNMHQNMERLQNEPDSNVHTFSQSSVMSYSNTGQGPPKVYQATTSTRTAPGGVRETRKAVRDSETATEKMAIGRHIKDRGHVISKAKNTRTGDMEENQDFVNIDEEEAPHFDSEWTQRAQQGFSQSQRDRDSRRHQPAMTDGRDRVKFPSIHSPNHNFPLTKGNKDPGISNNKKYVSLPSIKKKMDQRKDLTDDKGTNNPNRKVKFTSRNKNTRPKPYG